MSKIGTGKAGGSQAVAVLLRIHKGSLISAHQQHSTPSLAIPTLFASWGADCRALGRQEWKIHGWVPAWPCQ